MNHDTSRPLRSVFIRKTAPGEGEHALTERLTINICDLENILLTCIVLFFLLHNTALLP